MNRSRELLANIATGVLVLCAVAVTAVVLRREFSGSGSATGAALVPARNAEAAMGTGHLLGRPGAPVRMVVFSDFQCPFCAAAVEEIDRLSAESGGRVAVAFRHFPIESIHPHAFAAALAVECAAEQGRFREYHDALFAAQALIGTRAWEEFAVDAEVPSVEDFRTCVVEERFASRVRADMAAGEAAGVTGTPSFVYDGKMGVGAPGLDALGSLALKHARR